MNTKANNIQIKPSKKKNENKVTIELSNELTIYTIESISDTIIDNVKKYDNIEIIGKDIKNIDLAFIQLIDAIKKTVEENGKKISLNININEENQILFDNTDISRIINNK